MKVIVAGSRDITDNQPVVAAIRTSPFEVTELVSGGARGVNSLALEMAKVSKLPFRLFEPDWAMFGKSAGPRRNRQMAEYADALVAVWDGKSRGTKNMIEEMEKLGKPVHIYLHRPWSHSA